MSKATTTVTDTTKDNSIGRNITMIDKWDWTLSTEVDNKTIILQKISNPEDYPQEVTLYAKLSTKGSTKNTMQYAIAIDDYKAHKPARVTVDSIEVMLSKGMTAEEVQSKLMANAMAKIQAKIAKANQ